MVGLHPTAFCVFPQATSPEPCADCDYAWETCQLGVRGDCLPLALPAPFRGIPQTHLPLVVVPLRSANVTCNMTSLPAGLTCNGTGNVVGWTVTDGFDPLALVGERFLFTVRAGHRLPAPLFPRCGNAPLGCRVRVPFVSCGATPPMGKPSGVGGCEQSSGWRGRARVIGVPSLRRCG